MSAPRDEQTAVTEPGNSREGAPEGERDSAVRSAAASPPASLDEESESILSIFGNTERSGAWMPAEFTSAIAGFGNVTLDLRKALLPAGVTEIDAYAVFGNIEITVPESLDVELSGVAFLGNVEHRSSKTVRVENRLRQWLGMEKKSEPEPRHLVDEEAVLVVSGTAVFGNVTVKVG